MYIRPKMVTETFILIPSKMWADYPLEPPPPSPYKEGGGWWSKQAIVEPPSLAG